MKLLSGKHRKIPLKFTYGRHKSTWEHISKGQRNNTTIFHGKTTLQITRQTVGSDKPENWQQREHGQEEIISRDYFLFWLRSSNKRFTNIKEKGKLFSKRNSLFQDWDSTPKKKKIFLWLRSSSKRYSKSQGKRKHFFLHKYQGKRKTILKKK